MAQAIEMEKKRVLMKAENAPTWHYKQMETNHDNYIGQVAEKKAKSRANHPDVRRASSKSRWKDSDEKDFPLCAL
jgi:hypothetical protein